MNFSQILPDWMPAWLQLLVVVVGIMLALCFVFMPFSVFGVKTRLEAMEARLDEIQGEIRMLALRLPEPGRLGSYDDEPAVRRAAEPERELRARPPIPPVAWRADTGVRARAQPPADNKPRSEPRLSR
jgi:hypothetical protein